MSRMCVYVVFHPLLVARLALGHTCTFFWGEKTFWGRAFFFMRSWVAIFWVRFSVRNLGRQLGFCPRCLDRNEFRPKIPAFHIESSLPWNINAIFSPFLYFTLILFNKGCRHQHIRSSFPRCTLACILPFQVPFMQFTPSFLHTLDHAVRH